MIVRISSRPHAPAAPPVPSAQFRKGAALFDNHIVFNPFRLSLRPFRAWVLGQEREAGSWQEDALQGHVHGYGGASERQNYVNVPTMLSVVPIDNNSTVSMTNAQKQAYVSDGAHGTPRIASDTRPENTIVPVILYLGQPK